MRTHNSLPPPSPTKLQVYPAQAESQEGSTTTAAYPWFIAGVGAWFAAIGMQSVIFSWLVVGVLRAKAEWVGIAQSASMIPLILFTLLAGAVADRRDRRVLLVGLHLLATLLSAGLVFVVASGWLSLPLLIAYALAMGTVQAFVMPARDSFLSEVAGSNMMRAVTGMMMAQWGTQIVGTLTAGTARWIGTVPTLCLHGLTLLTGALILSKLPPAPPHGGVPQTNLRLLDVGEGVNEVIHSPMLLPVLLLGIAVGAFFIGPFMVVFPILIRDYYGGDVAQLALLSTAFPVGTILGSLAILWHGDIRRKGAAQLIALIAGSGCLAIVSFGLPFWGTLVMICAWGISAAIFGNTGRTIFQERARPSHRARVLSVHTLGFMGSAGLVGAPLSGVLVEHFGPLATCAVSSGAMVVVAALAFLFTGIAQVE
jgi:MFS family permease